MSIKSYNGFPNLICSVLIGAIKNTPNPYFGVFLEDYGTNVQDELEALTALRSSIIADLLIYKTDRVSVRIIGGKEFLKVLRPVTS